ncbi:hypothetical protein QM616_24880, partial [Rhodococcus fascians]|uniref:hypothetical protein n=1 Tax=Rhodococcoides fascians TaxID=1828 RepID=UPI0024B6D06C
RQQFMMNRYGFLEETYRTFSYSPIHGPERAVLGVLVATSEVTQQLLGERRLQALLSLGTLTGNATDGAV